MAKLVWDESGKRVYETGVRNGVLYVQDEQGAYTKGVAWNGLTAVTESPSGAEPTALYADDIKYLELFSAEEFGATIEAYTYPEEFEACDGSASLGKGVTIGHDIKGNENGYKLHLIYGAKAKPSEKAYATVNDSPEAITFSWEVSTTPVNVAGFKPTASITIDSTKIEFIYDCIDEELIFHSNEHQSVGELAEMLTFLDDKVQEILEELSQNQER